jgi:hypothetical protein
MTEFSEENLYVHAEPYVHVLFPDSDNGTQLVPAEYMDVFGRDLREQHDAYIIRPYIVYYIVHSAFYWERFEVNIPFGWCPFIQQDQLFSREWIGTLGWHRYCSEDITLPFRTGIARYSFIDGQWVQVDSAESQLGFLYLDRSPYSTSVPVPIPQQLQQIQGVRKLGDVEMDIFSTLLPLVEGELNQGQMIGLPQS